MNDGMDLMQAQAAYRNNQPVPDIPKNANIKEMREVAIKFEAMFLSQALQPMFANIEPASPFGGGAGDEIWRSMQVDEYGKAIARSGGIGIADAVMEQMLKAQEAN
ncbi:MAG: rod-binding protein [Alphaproteobacteria bacterium]|nr:rod-binding protein [Alphaproteobacteria bacterium]